ncbi:GumC family protein [Rhodopirellula sp. MGV]|uniref:GumC family protein n=1 Tax=Rhodopirellula sp. MGV TaxID=2023130 RepID=UPI000B975168|nr:polysaccharide biosynthesis tyrosine autokinase [Rhodopirellula sp. MGV]OYP34111.1 hypothetical protein CGZ80_16440 [Rhodopirellula sp. MGV]PNY35624.1 hypothetical protein C2E31_17325 [Rhodopirellula baltica]PNY37356.1 hypothetical protein C2E31_08230 [Rhodopirellula baltica]
MSSHSDEAQSDGMEFDIDVVGILRRRYHLIALGLLVGATLATIFYVKQKPVYQSSLAVLVGQRSSQLATTGVREASDNAVTIQDKILSTHIALMTSPKVLGQAADEHDLGKSAGEIAGKLSVGKDGEASILRATYQDGNPEVAAKVLEAVFETYFDYVETRSQSVGSEAAELIANAQAKNEEELRAADKAYRDFVASVPALVLSGGNIQRDRLTAIEAELNTIRRTIAEIETRRQKISSSVKGQRPEELTDAQLATLLSKEDISRLQMFMDFAEGRSKVEEKALTEEERMALALERQAQQEEFRRLMALTTRRDVMRATFGDSHPSVRSLDSEIVNLRKYVDNFRAGSEKDAGEEIVETVEAGRVFDVPPSEILKTYYSVLKGDIAGLKKREEELVAQSEQEAKVAKEVELSMLEGTSLKANLERAQARYDEVFKRLQELNLTNDYSGFATDLLVQPVPARFPIWPSKSKIAMAGLMAGGMLGLALAVLAELIDRTFKNPGEVEKAAGASIIAHLPQMVESKLAKQAKVGSKISPMITTFHQPRGIDAETFRVLRTTLLFMAKRQSKKIFMITSPSPADGKSTTIANLAVSMAQTGKRVLLVDADMRRPTIASRFGVERGPGLSDYLHGDATLMECLHHTEQENLVICPSGSRTSSPSELLESDRFLEFIENVREGCDLVFFDAPPVLAVADPAIIALHVDCVLMGVRIEKNNRTLVERAADILREQSTPAEAVIVNGRASRRGYGYTGYNYYSKKEYGYVSTYRRYYEADADGQDEDRPIRSARAATSSRVVNGKVNGHAKHASDVAEAAHPVTLDRK